MKTERVLKIPNWYVSAWRPPPDVEKWWEYQVLLAKEHKGYEEPSETLRKAEMHKKFSLSFYDEVPKDFETILDVGCSDGWMCKIFKEDGKKAIGINDFIYPTDYSFILKNGLDIRIMDMHMLDFGDEEFDAIWLRHALEHSIAPLIVLAECHRVLKVGGYIFIALPPELQPPKYYAGHYNIIPSYQLEYFLKIYRFEILKLHTKYLSFKTKNDNLEIQCIAKKSKERPGELHHQE